MAEDAAQEERQRRLRHPVACRYRRFSTIAPAIIESCQTRLLLPNERAIEPQITAIYRRFGLNDRQIEILARATPKRDYYCQSRRGNRLFELGLVRCALALCAASSKTDQAAIDRISPSTAATVSSRPGCARGVGWAADLIPNLTNLSDSTIRRRRHDVRSCARRSPPAPPSRLSPLSPDRSQVSALIVFDPANYAQNVLTAARALEQINNQITSLQNEAQMLINQARNLASLPFSSLQPVAAIGAAHAAAARAGAEHRLRRPADRSGVQLRLRQCLASASDQQLVDWRARALAEHGRRPSGRHARAGRAVVGNIDTNRSQMSRAGRRQPVGATGALQATQAGNQLLALQAQQLADLTAVVAAKAGPRRWSRREQAAAAGAGPRAAPPLPDARLRLPARHRPHVPRLRNCAWTEDDGADLAR